MEERRALRLPLGTLGSPHWVGAAFYVASGDFGEDFELSLDLRYCFQEYHLELDLLDMLLHRGKATGTQAQTMPTLISATLGTSNIRILLKATSEN